MDNLSLIQQLLLAIGVICAALAIAIGLVAGGKDDFDGMAQFQGEASVTVR